MLSPNVIARLRQTTTPEDIAALVDAWRRDTAWRVRFDAGLQALAASRAHRGPTSASSSASSSAAAPAAAPAAAKTTKTKTAPAPAGSSAPAPNGADERGAEPR